MGKYAITYAGRDSDEPFAPYKYDILLHEQKVAELGHDYRGDEHWLRLPGGQWITVASRIMEGGGPQPLSLSSDGVQLVDRLIG